MMINMHEHLWEKDSLDGIVKESNRLGIDKVCVSALGPPYNQVGNDTVEKAMREYPDLIIGFAYFRLGTDDPSLIDKFYQKGFKGIKFHIPKSNYDDKAYYEVYSKIEKFGLPTLFHTGMVMRTEKDRQCDISAARMRPIYLDTIARAFPNLKIIGAHLGIPWFEEACEVAYSHPNAYFDLTGRGIVRLSSFFEKRMSWWENIFEKIVFGTDSGPGGFQRMINIYRQLMEDLKLDSYTQKKVFGETAAEILGISDEKQFPEH